MRQWIFEEGLIKISIKLLRSMKKLFSSVIDFRGAEVGILYRKKNGVELCGFGDGNGDISATFVFCVTY